MKFLTDVNASGILAKWLREMGHDIVRVSTKKLLEDVLTHYADDLQAGAIVIADTRKIRVRRSSFSECL